jgi:hypothetical protein
LRDAPLCIILVRGKPKKENAMRLTEAQADVVVEQVKAARDRIVKALAVPELGNGNMTMPDVSIVALMDVLVMVTIASLTTNRARARDTLSEMLDRALDDLTSDKSLAALAEAKRKYPEPTGEAELAMARDLGLFK